MNWKETYTKIFLRAANKTINETAIKEYHPIWWKNTRAKDSGGLRLTDEGFRFITEDIELTTYDVPYPAEFDLTTNVVIWMDNFIDCPYYLGRHGIVVTNEQTNPVDVLLYMYSLNKTQNKEGTTTWILQLVQLAQMAQKQVLNMHLLKNVLFSFGGLQVLVNQILLVKLPMAFQIHI